MSACCLQASTESYQEEEKNMAFCTNCGSELPENSNHCPNCGAPVTPGPAGQPDGASSPQDFNNPAYSQQPYAYNSQPYMQDPVPQVPTGGLLAWSIITLLLYTIPGIVALVNVTKINKCTTIDEQQQKIKNAKIWCTVGTVLGILAVIGQVAANAMIL